MKRLEIPIKEGAKECDSVQDKNVLNIQDATARADEMNIHIENTF